MKTIKKYTSKKPVKTTNKMILRGFPQGISSSELKYIDNDFIDGQNQANYGYVSMNMMGGPINGLEVGTSQSQRIGQEVVFKEIHVKYSFWKASSSFALGQNPIGRFLIVVDRQPNGLSFTQSELFDQGVPSANNNFRCGQSFYNLSNRKRFQILYDKSHALNESGEGYVFKEVNLKCNIKTNYNKGTTTAIANTMNNAIYCVMFSNITTTRADIEKFHGTFNSRLRYMD